MSERLFDRLDSDAMACAGSPTCRVANSGYCMFGPSDVCHHVASAWLRLRAVHKAAENLIHSDAIVDVSSSELVKLAMAINEAADDRANKEGDK